MMKICVFVYVLFAVILLWVETDDIIMIYDNVRPYLRRINVRLISFGEKKYLYLYEEK